ncbi:hypothetical protein MSIMFI_04444 [Mycobacterium simulans]|nr:hypothetical protein MSIMFI_04444 [Mycobacterium simulans]
MTLFRLMLDTPSMKELSVAEQRYQAVISVIADDLSISHVAEKMGVLCRTRHTRLAS